MPGEPLVATVTLASNSGVEVPKPTKIKPIKMLNHVSTSSSYVFRVVA